MQIANSLRFLEHPRASALLLGMIVVLSAWIPYREAGENGFVFDDVVIVQNNPRVHGLGQIGEIFRTEYWNLPEASSRLYRPLTLLSYAVEFELLGPEPGHFHLVNVALHCVACLLLSGLALLVLGRIPTRPSQRWRERTLYLPAFSAGVLFAVHPLHSEAVAGIVGRGEILAAIFSLATLNALLMGGRWRIASPVFLLCGLLCKESAALTLPLVVLLHAYGLMNGASGRKPRLQSSPDERRRFSSILSSMGRSLLLLSPGLLAALALRQLVVGDLPAPTILFVDNPLVNASFFDRWATSCVLFARYLRLHFWPVPLSPDYSYDAIAVRSFGDPEALGSLLLLLGMGSLCILGFKRARGRTDAWTVASFFLAWFVLGTMVLSHFFFLLSTVLGERLAYLPGAGLFLLFGLLVRAAVRREDPRVRRVPELLVPGLFLLIVLGCQRLTEKRTAAWKNAKSLFEQAVRDQPRSYRVWTGLALAQTAERRFEEALASFRKAEEIYPEYPQKWAQLAGIHWDMGDVPAARAAAEKLQRQSRRNVISYYILAESFLREGNLADAGEQARVGLGVDSTYLPLSLVAGRISEARNQPEIAIEHYLKVIRGQPELLALKREVGPLLVRLERWPEAVELFRDLIQREKEAGTADWSQANYLAWSLLQSVREQAAGKDALGGATDTVEVLAEAEQAALSAVDLAPPLERRYPLDTLAEVQRAQGRRAEAIATLERLVRDFPDDERYRKALEQYRSAGSQGP